MDFKKLANQYKDELLDNVLPFWLENSQDMSMAATSPVWIVKEEFSIQINLSGCKAAKCGCSPCFTIKWKNVRNGWIVPFKVVNF